MQCCGVVLMCDMCTCAGDDEFVVVEFVDLRNGKGVEMGFIICFGTVTRYWLGNETSK